ncbi:MAG: hypothetical protein JXA77_06270 [Bacteroidales bacterium]|nr:hypothetical protein [Bacteroidales bacterium]MBN2819828.1 hypothetical protein [Bacteroidales bacterium]
MKKLFLFIIPVLLMVTACETSEGRGGSSSIKGSVFVQEYNKDMTIKVGDPYAAQDVDVYIIYGDDEIYGDKFQTGYDGKYEFSYLQEGKYKVYVLSKSLDIIHTNELVPIMKEVEIIGKDQVVEVETITIID